MEQRLLVISPVRNEADNIERTVLGVAAQTRRPDLWLIVDDESTDETPQLLSRLTERFDFISVIDGQPSKSTSKDRLVVAAEARAFNTALKGVPWQTFTHVAKLDGDIELPPDYFERLLDEFQRDPALGLAGGVLRERDGRQGREDAPSDYHVRGALKCYATDCLQAIGGIQERLAWDAIDEIYARMKGFKTRTVPDLIGLHLRTCGSADGILRGSARHGTCAYILHMPLPWVSLRAVKMGSYRPVILSGFAFLGGHLWAGVVKTPRVEDPAFRAFVRRELGTRTRRAFAPRRWSLSREM